MIVEKDVLIKAFESDLDENGNFNFNVKVKKIGNMAYSECYNLRKINIPYGTKEIGEGAFAGCKKLSAIVIPKGMKKIGDWTFADCINLQSTTILEGKIGEGAFYGCKNLKEINITEKTKINEHDKEYFENHGIKINYLPYEELINKNKQESENDNPQNVSKKKPLSKTTSKADEQGRE